MGRGDLGGIGGMMQFTTRILAKYSASAPETTLQVGFLFWAIRYLSPCDPVDMRSNLRGKPQRHEPCTN